MRRLPAVSPKAYLSRARALLGAGLLLVLAACAVNKLGSDLDRAAQNYAYIKLRMPPTNQAGGEFLLALYRNGPDGRELLSSRTPNPGQSSVYLVTRGSYTVVLFEDVNGDFAYQEGEPVQVLVDPVRLAAHRTYSADLCA